MPNVLLDDDKVSPSYARRNRKYHIQKRFFLIAERIVMSFGVTAWAETGTFAL